MNLVVQIKESNAIITYDPLPTANGDENLLVMLFQNIIANAIKYHSSETPKIHVSSKNDNGQNIISIQIMV